MSRINPLRRLYNSLSEQLSEDDERSLRNLLRGEQLTTRELEHLNSPAEIFIKLEESGHISKTELVLLKELLGELKRPPLVLEVERVEKELQECKFERVSNELKVKKTDIPQDVRYDQFIHSDVSASAKSTHDDADLILQCQATLRKTYKRLSHILPLPWLDGADSRLKLEDIYTELDLQSSDGTKKLVQREDIFSCSGDDENTNRILIEGDPGYGKSTFCKMIAYDWAKGETNYLRDFRLLFLFELKALQEYHSENTGKQSLKDAIFDLVLRGVKENDNLFSFIENNQSKVCFIFDGLDEVSSSNLPSYFKQMVQQKHPLLQGCHVIVTSRTIRDADSKSMYDRKLSIGGLDRAKVKLFLKNYLKCQGSIRKAGGISFAETFIEEVGNSLSTQVLYSLMESPLNAIMLCEIWKQNGKVPQFITEIYKAIVEYMVKRYCKKTKYHTFNDTEMKETLLFLGKKSHEGLLSGKGQLFLTEDEIKSQPHILQLGFLSKPSTSSQGYSFFHRTFQEYFAALYIADLCSTNHSEFADIIDVSEFPYRKCSDITFIFVAGLLKDKQSKMFEIWYRNMDRCIHLFDPIFILQESGFFSPELISLCSKVLPDLLIVKIADLENNVNKSKLEIIKLLLQCSDIRSDTVCIQVSASNPNASKIYRPCRVRLKSNSKKLEVRLEIDCDLSKCAVKHHLHDLAFASDSYADDLVSLHFRNHGDSDMLRSIPDILDAFSKITAKKHVITGLPLCLNLIDVVLLKLNDTRCLQSVWVLFDEQKSNLRSGIQHTRAVQITSKVGKCKICCNINDVNFDLVTFQRLLECCTSSAGEREVLNITLTCDFRIEAVQTYVENILDRMMSVNIDELILELLSHAQLDIKKICPQIDAIIKRVSSISVQTFTIKGFPVGSLELIENVHAHLSSNKSLKSIRVVFIEYSDRYKVRIDAKFGNFNICYETPSMDFDLASFHQLLLQYASSNDKNVILNLRVTCAGDTICIGSVHDVIRRMESVPIDNIAVEFSEYALKDLTDVCGRLIGLVKTLSLISARDLVITGLPIGNVQFIADIHKVIFTNQSTGSVRIIFREVCPNVRQEKLKITANVGSLESGFKMNDINFDLSRLQKSLSELPCQSTVSFDITIKCDFRENDVGSYVKNLFSRFKYVDINELSLLVCGYANSDTKDVTLCVNNIMNDFKEISTEQLDISGLPDENGQINFITLLYQRLHNNITLKKVFIAFTMHPPSVPYNGETIQIIIGFGKFRIVYDLNHLTFELPRLYQSLSHQASLHNDKVTLYITIYRDLNDRALESFIKDMTANMKAVDIAQITFNIFNFTTENANRIQNILTSFAQVRMQRLVVLGIPLGNLDVLSETFTKRASNTVCYFLSRPTCPSYCKSNLLQHSSVIAYSNTHQINLRICKASCDLVNFYQRFLQIGLPDESGVKIEAHVSYDGNGPQADSDIQYLLAGHKFLRFEQLSFLDRCNYNKLSVEGRDTMDVLKSVVALNCEIIHYENCPIINFKFAKAVLDIMLRSRSSNVVMSFREKMNSSRILDTINSFENDGLEIHTLELTSCRVSVQGKYIKSPMSAKVVKLIFPTSHSVNSHDYPRDDIRADTSPFQERYDLPITLLKYCGIHVESDVNTIGQNQTKGSTLTSLSQYVSALTSVTDVLVLDGEIIPGENVEHQLTKIMTKDSLGSISFRGCNLNKIDRLAIDCMKKTDRVRKSPLKIRLCHAFSSTNITMLKDALETEGFVHRTYFFPSVGKNGAGWSGKRVEIILIPCNQDNVNHVIKQQPLVEIELLWWAYNDMQNRRNDYIPWTYE